MFRGTYTAIATPFRDDETIDEAAFGRLIDFNVAGGVAGIVPCGTTGESPTLSTAEHNRLVELAVEFAAGRVRVLAGAGSNSTREAISLTQHAERAARCRLVDHSLLQQADSRGFVSAFQSRVPKHPPASILYNIKGRTAVNIETPTLMRLAADCPNIVAVKEASGDMDQIKAVLAARPKGFGVLSGDDALTLDVVRLGGQGVISVVSNALPREMSELTRLALVGDFAEAAAIYDRVKPLFSAAFIETNPIPIKYILSLMGMCREVYRLPLCELRPESKAVVDRVVHDLGLVKSE